MWATRMISSLRLKNERIFQYLLLGALTLFAAVLRLYKLGEWSFWVDEIASINSARTVLGHVLSFPPPRISFIITHFALNYFGVSEWSSRLASTAIGILSLPVLYFPIRKMFNSAVGLIAVLLLAISPWHIFWSQSARFYTSLALFYTLALFMFFLGIEQDRFWYILLSLILFFFALGERLLAFFYIPVVILYVSLLKVLPYKKPPGLRLKNLLPLFLVIMVGMLLFFFDLYRLRTTGSSFLLDEFSYFLGKPIDNPLRIFSYIIFSIGIPLSTFAFFGGIYVLLQKSGAGLLVFIGAYLPFLFIVLVTPFVFTTDRYVFMALPCLVTLAAVAVKDAYTLLQAHRKVLAIGALAILLASSLGDDLLYYTVNHGNRYDWKSVFALVQEQSVVGDQFVSTRPQIGAYYFHQEIKDFKEMNPDTIAQSGSRYWFIVDSEKIWGNRKMKRWLEENGHLINFQYLRLPKELNLRIYLYSPR